MIYIKNLLYKFVFNFCRTLLTAREEDSQSSPVCKKL